MLRATLQKLPDVSRLRSPASAAIDFGGVRARGSFAAGDYRLTLRHFGQLFDEFEFWFPIVTP